MRRMDAFHALALAAALGLALVTRAAADDQTAADTLTIHEQAVDASTLDEQVGTAATGDAPADLTSMPATAGPAGSEPPPLMPSQGDIGTGAISSSSLQATIGGGAVSLE
jgi:hypothetical protein